MKGNALLSFLLTHPRKADTTITLLLNNPGSKPTASERNKEQSTATHSNPLDLLARLERKKASKLHTAKRVDKPCVGLGVVNRLPKEID